jgi:hypothetical protein
MTPFKRHLRFHLTVGVALYLLFAALDSYFTLWGIQGDITLEGNPIMQYMMTRFGPLGGLIIEKALVLVIALAVAIAAALGIEKDAGWVYSLAFTQTTRNWLKREKRRWVAFIPIYFVAAAQGVAAASWVVILVETTK